MAAGQPGVDQEVKLKELTINEDERGLLVEAFKFPSDGQLFYVFAAPNETRGQHYHLRKTEHFLVISGSAQIACRDRKTGNLMKVDVAGGRPMVVTVTPNTTHSITSEGGCTFLVWATEQYNKQDPDTYPEEI